MPGDVLSYRRLWDPYVVAMVKAASIAGDAWEALASGAVPTTRPNVGKFATPPTPSVLQTEADVMHGYAASLLSSWNMHAGMSDVDLVLQASAVLQDFQAVVERAGSFYAPLIAKDVPDYPLPTPPSFSVQAQVIGQIEGLGIVAHGVLQLLGIGVSGALSTYGAIGSTVASVATSAAATLPALAVGVGLLGLGLLAFSRRR